MVPIVNIFLRFSVEERYFEECYLLFLESEYVYIGRPEDDAGGEFTLKISE